MSVPEEYKYIFCVLESDLVMGEKNELVLFMFLTAFPENKY